jgi:hypothetical protein
MAKTKPSEPKTNRVDKLDVMGVTRDGVKILKQGRSGHFTQKQALEICRKVVAARAL